MAIQPRLIGLINNTNYYYTESGILTRKFDMVCYSALVVH